MPAPSVEPTPCPSAESRVDVPLDAHEASYLAASARMMSLRRVSMASRNSVGLVILYESPVYDIPGPLQAPAGRGVFLSTGRRRSTVQSSPAASRLALRRASNPIS